MDVQKGGKKPNSGSFGHGKDAREAARKRWENQEEVPAELEQTEAQGSLLEAMQHVVSKPASRDRSDIHKAARKWLAEDVTRFMSKLADLEAKQEAKGGTCPQCAEREQRIKEEEADEGLLRRVLRRVIDQAKQEAGV